MSAAPHAYSHTSVTDPCCVHDDEPVNSHWRRVAPFQSAAEQPDVLDACRAAQTEVDALLQSSPLRRPGPQTPATVAQLREVAAFAQASLEGAQVSAAAYRAIRGDGSPLSRTISTAEALLDASRTDAAMFATSPLRALARWHVLATSDAALPREDRGRPRIGGEPVIHDSLNLRVEPLDAGPLLQSVIAIVELPQLPALAAASAAHALLAAGQPFAHSNALLARIAARALLVARGCDPDGLVPWEERVLAWGRPRYVAALTRLATSESDADAQTQWAEWIQWHCRCVADAAAHARTQL